MSERRMAPVVQLALAEVLINAITHDRIPGLQLKRGFGAADERACFDALTAIIERHRENERRLSLGLPPMPPSDA